MQAARKQRAAERGQTPAGARAVAPREVGAMAGVRQPPAEERGGVASGRQGRRQSLLEIAGTGGSSLVVFQKWMDGYGLCVSIP